MSKIADDRVDEVWQRLVLEARDAGYSVNPDDAFARDLVRGLLENEERYGYRACPCRLASGVADEDLDLVCPCDYRDADLNDYGVCYCALYVSPGIAAGTQKAVSIPDRRPVGGPAKHVESTERLDVRGLAFPVWRCKVCGYLCARPQPPLVCPVCKAGKERFERFM
ncbi:MAG TPA: ferredoxin-thioredoxin reductase catalytic domain-containing protein [Clostridia bacterium]|nr:ferredoxin-thioredoxin reductase catalytic domain-containing protein [Clostridia bacterium]